MRVSFLIYYVSRYFRYLGCGSRRPRGARSSTGEPRTALFLAVLQRFVFRKCISWAVRQHGCFTQNHSTVVPSFFASWQVLLQNVTPSAVRVTPHWNALLRPNYAHAREGPAWTTVSLREPLPQAVRSTAPRRKPLANHRASLSSGDEPFTAPFSDTTRPDYQVFS